MLVRQVHRQLRMHQKRKGVEELRACDADLGSRSPKQLLPSMYLTSIERSEMLLGPEGRVCLSPQGQYPARPGNGLATCGVSSTGLRSGLISSGRYDVHDESSRKEFVADLRAFGPGVRAREGEFLCGNSADEKGNFNFMVSWDGNAIDPEKVKVWAEVMEGLLGDVHDAKDAIARPKL